MFTISNHNKAGLRIVLDWDAYKLGTKTNALECAINFLESQSMLEGVHFEVFNRDKWYATIRVTKDVAMFTAGGDFDIEARPGDNEIHLLEDRL